MKYRLLAALICFPILVNIAQAVEISDQTGECLMCHNAVTPGIVADWKKSLHAKVTMSEALRKPKRERRVSVAQAPDNSADVVVGCAECHTINPEDHQDTFDHNDHQVHIVVTPKDCAGCHMVETEQYSQNIMSQAYGNLKNNPLYHSLMDSINGVQSFENMQTSLAPADEATNADSCFYCHGTKVEVKGMASRDTEMGEMEFPVLTGWPNQGVGRINPDGSKGACTPCHPRHQFSIEVARKPAACIGCHKGPDVPAYQVYNVSKHGNIYSAVGKDWDFKAVPWVLGRDFTAPTCATCHISQIVTEDGEVVAERSHQLTDRLPFRLFGLIYAHPFPKSPDTTIIRNKAGLPLPTELTGEPVTEYLIDENEQQKRLKTMQKICLACHSQQWVAGHFTRLKHTIEYTNRMTLTATRIMLTAWEKGAAKGLTQNDSIFNESIEKKWVAQWLFFANSTRFASAMAGADYGVFANGRWFMSKNIQEMADWLEFKLKMMEDKKDD